MYHWKIKEHVYDKEKATVNGNKYLVGNGYMGIRGTLDEYEKEFLPAVNLTGIYDRVGEAWREPLNAPNALYTYVEVNQIRYTLPDVTPNFHEVCLDYRSGIFSRKTGWKSSDGQIQVASERFTSFVDPHIIGVEYKVTTDFDGIITLITGIDADVWDINGPHYKEMTFAVKNEADQSIRLLQALGTTAENEDQICVLEIGLLNEFSVESILNFNNKLLRKININAKKGSTYVLHKLISIYTSKDDSDYLARAEESILNAKELGYEKIKHQHIAAFEKKWTISEIIIDGDDKAMEALNYSLYHLHCIAPRHSDSLSIAARGLSGQTYKGAVFWDTEMFILDFFIKTEPNVARTLVKYRIDTLEGAIAKAKLYGYQGAFYAWESQEGGYDACSDYNITDVFTNRPMRTHFKDKQIHISGAIVYGIMSYVNATNDTSVLLEGGIEVILECAIFYYGLLVRKLDSKQYELHDVIGPDEYHERVNNNGYTNRMAKYVFDIALELINKMEFFELDNIKKKYEIDILKQKFEDASLHIYIQKPDEFTGIIEQFDGYSKLTDTSIADVKTRLLHPKEYWGGAYGVATHTKIIKQADVVTSLTLFSEEYDKDTLWRNWEYYESRTEHGSSLSACMYALLACKCDEPDKAYPYFMKSASADIKGGGKEWAGLVYIGGTHPAAAGGAYMTAIQGFGGVSLKNGEITIEPRLPKQWRGLKFHYIYKGEIYLIDIKALKKEDGTGKRKAVANITKC